jgi:hypothetical protein
MSVTFVEISASLFAGLHPSDDATGSVRAPHSRRPQPPGIWAGSIAHALSKRSRRGTAGQREASRQRF